jgi:GDPmannose 4,6-dehydratase
MNRRRIMRALITGITGQDGSYLADILLRKGYEVFGVVRRSSSSNFGRIEHLRKKMTFLYADLLDHSSLCQAVQDSSPDEIYNLAAQSFVPTSWSQPTLTAEFTAIGVCRLLEAFKTYCPTARFYQASSSEMFGKVKQIPQSETTPFHPRSPYGVAKVFGHHITVNYRESFDLFAVSGIMFNHESPRRGPEFVTRKITDGAVKIKLGLLDQLRMGNLDSMRDWGFARDYMEAAWLMLQQDEPDDYVIATGVSHSVREFADVAFRAVGLNYEDHVVLAEEFIRPAEVEYLLGDPSKAKLKLGWTPTVSFSELVEMMVQSDYDYYSRNK